MRNYEIKTDLHTHTLASTHAYSTLEENCRGAFANGLEGINMSDHGPSMPDAPYEGHFSNMRILPESIHGVKVWKGAEANIVDYDGNIDLTEHTLGRLPYENKPSTLQDLEVGKRTEVDMFAGTVVRLGKELGVETPVCECFLHGIHLIEARMFKEI